MYLCSVAYKQGSLLYSVAYKQGSLVHSLPISSFICAKQVTQSSCTSTQDFVEAFMMGTHAHLGAHSPVLLLDPYLAVSIAQIIIADRW
jgi:hypothetical protein